MNIALLIKCAIVGASLVAIVWVFAIPVRADLRANPAKAKPWAGTEEIRAYIAALDYSTDEGEDDEPVETDRTPDPDHIRDLQIARELGVA